MKTKKIISLAALALIASSTGASTVFAADGGVYSSDSTITYTPASGPTNPVDPGNPGITVDPEGPKNPGTDGPLSIDYASNFNFGTQEITSAGSKLQIIVEHLLVGPFLFKPQNSQTEKQVQVLY